MDTHSVQKFLSGLLDNSEAFKSSSKTETTDAEVSKAFVLTRSIEGNITTIMVNPDPLHATVPANATTNQFVSAQAFVDAVLAFIADEGNDITVTDGVIENVRP